jgi:phenylacetate-CoA ligase
MERVMKILDKPQTVAAVKSPRAARPGWMDRLSMAALAPRDWVLRLMAISYRSFIWGLAQLSPGYLAWDSLTRARRAFFRAARHVPAYASFLAAQRTGADTVPETDKESYIKAYPIAARCIGGRIPARHVMIDESSGSTGTPYNWVRSEEERHHSHLFVNYFASYCFGTQPRITINAFSMGAWATGINMGMAMEGNSIVKNTGPDIAKILGTLRFFGPGYEYLVTGYPPFLKHLIDAAEAERFPLHEYRLDALVGGEGMAEGLRDYLLRRFRKVYSGYGATDLEIAIAGETPIAVAIRRLARANPAVRQTLFGDDTRLPMLFQYNALMHYIEVNENGELLVTITRGNVLSPRIRYNVHDSGGVARYDEMAGKLAATGFDIDALADMESGPRLKLPFVWVYGRRDYTISVMGANIYPEDLEQCIYAEPDLAGMTRSFCLSLTESADGQPRPCFLFEIESAPTEALRQRFVDSMVARLLALNADFREAWKEYPEVMRPDVQLFRAGEGPFAADQSRIKQTRVLLKN